ncbi:MAG TPA: cupredoxin family protein [Burkholderiaceae bacterium]|nr:cupredoxin family protein [Burkholderiaceae bacterium]
MNAVRFGLALALATGGGTALAHGDEGHPTKEHTYDAAKVEEHAFGREGNPKKVTRTIKVDMSDAFRFTPELVTIQRGQTVKFVVSNSGKQLHEMVLGTADELKKHAELMRKFPGMEHADANMAHVKPGARGEIVWQFTQAGEYQFACLIPGHFEAGMIGKVIVK